MRKLVALLDHCLVCTSLDGCYFVKRNMPKQPQHEHCDCKTQNKNFHEVQAKSAANCPIEKWTDYIFAGNGKENIFKSWGYTKNDSHFLKSEFEKQTLNQYLNGNYILKTLDKYGQRLAIQVN